MRLLKIGRDPSCDIVLHSMRASALHAEITVLNNGDIILEDKDSKNGTYIMNSPIKPNTPVNIKRGDTIRFADVELLWDQVPTPEDNNKYKAIYGIGTNFRNEIQVSGNTISRFHATLKIDKKGNAILQDHSKNGTTVNGRRINFGQSIKITKKDAVVCGGIPVNLSSYIPGYSPIYKIIGVAATIIVLLGLAYGSWLAIDGKYSTVSPITTEAIEEATVCVFGGYYYEVTIKDDPFKDIDGIVSQWYVGGNNDVIMASTTTKDIPPFEYSGTAFFISENGELGTNRHIAVPWEYRKKEEEEGIRHLIEKERIKREIAQEREERLQRLREEQEKSTKRFKSEVDEERPRTNSNREKVETREETTIVVLSADHMGEGNEELGKVLMKGFIYALTELDKLPKKILLFNSGAKLSVEGSDSLEDLKLLESKGVEILTCGACLNFYEISNQLAVGSVTNMYAIAESMMEASKIIKP